MATSRDPSRNWGGLDEHFHLRDVQIFCFTFINAKKVREAAATAGTGDHDVDDDAVVDAGPSRKEALQASITLKKYVQGLDDSFARKLEGMLTSFGHQTRFVESRNLKPTLVTDYFSRIN